MQRLAGVSNVLYWLVHFAIDHLIVFNIATVFGCIMLLAFQMWPYNWALNTLSVYLVTLAYG